MYEALKYFLSDAGERAAKTAAQVSLGLLTADHVVGIVDVNWAELASVTLLAVLVSFLTSLASYNVGEKGTAALGRDPVRAALANDEECCDVPADGDGND
jgi:hypothetical protein